MSWSASGSPSEMCVLQCGLRWEEIKWIKQYITSQRKDTFLDFLGAFQTAKK